MRSGMRPPLTPERWRVVIPYLDRALEMEGPRREAWLAALREEDEALAPEVEALLAREQALDDERFLDAPLVPAPLPASLSGQTIGAYTLRDPIGQGGMGTVWLAERADGLYRGRAAVKLLNVSLVGQEGEARFRREAGILARLRHPHIAQLLDAGVSPLGQPYLILELVE